MQQQQLGVLVMARFEGLGESWWVWSWWMCAAEWLKHLAGRERVLPAEEAAEWVGCRGQCQLGTGRATLASLALLFGLGSCCLLWFFLCMEAACMRDAYSELVFRKMAANQYIRMH